MATETPLPSARPAPLASELEWINEATERDGIDFIHTRLRSALPGWPDAFPPDLRHDIHVCRFLRGHGCDAAKAADALLAAVQYRMELIAKEPVRRMREAMGVETCTLLDLSLLPHSAEALRCLPFRTIGRGASASGLPLALVPIRCIDPRSFSEIDGDVMELFMRCMLEARAVLLHSLSLQQRRMVKFVEVRDFNNVSIAELLTQGRHFIGRLKGVLQSLQSHYPVRDAYDAYACQQSAAACTYTRPRRPPARACAGSPPPATPSISRPNRTTLTLSLRPTFACRTDPAAHLVA